MKTKRTGVAARSVLVTIIALGKQAIARFSSYQFITTSQYVVKRLVKVIVDTFVGSAAIILHAFTCKTQGHITEIDQMDLNFTLVLVVIFSITSMLIGTIMAAIVLDKEKAVSKLIDALSKLIDTFRDLFKKL